MKILQKSYTKLSLHQSGLINPPMYIAPKRKKKAKNERLIINRRRNPEWQKQKRSKREDKNQTFT